MLSLSRPCSRVTRGAAGCAFVSNATIDAATARSAGEQCSSPRWSEGVRQIDAPKSCASWRSDEFGINATRNRCEVCTCDLRLGTTQLISAAAHGGVGFFEDRESSFFLIIIPFVVNNECASSLLHAWTAARVGAAAARSIPPPHISQPRPPQPQ